MADIIVQSERIYDTDFYKENTNKITTVDLNGYEQEVEQKQLFSITTPFYNSVDENDTTTQGKTDNSIYYDEIAFCKSSTASIYECTLYANKECTRVLELKEGNVYKVYTENADINAESSIYFFVKYITSLLKHKFVGYNQNDNSAIMQATSTPNPALLIINDYGNVDPKVARAFYYEGKYPTLQTILLTQPFENDYWFYGSYIKDKAYNPYKKYTQNSYDYWGKNGEYLVDNVTSYIELPRGRELVGGKYDPDIQALYAKLHYAIDIDKSVFYNKSNSESIAKAIGDVVATFNIQYDTNTTQETKAVYKTENFAMGYPQGTKYVIEYGEKSVYAVEDSLLVTTQAHEKVVNPNFNLEYYVYFSTEQSKVLILSHIKETATKTHTYQDSSGSITITYTFLLNHSIGVDVSAPQITHKNSTPTDSDGVEHYNGEEIEFNLVDNSRYAEMTQNILKEYENGKETFEIECSVNDYYYGSWDSANNRIAYELDEYGKPIKAIDISGKQTDKMVFEIGDIVIPMKYTNKGDMPMSQYIDGTARAYRVTGVSYSYNGVVMQKIRGQEISRENLTNSILSANIETYRSMR